MADLSAAGAACGPPARRRSAPRATAGQVKRMQSEFEEHFKGMNSRASDQLAASRTQQAITIFSHASGQPPLVFLLLWPFQDALRDVPILWVLWRNLYTLRQSVRFSFDHRAIVWSAALFSTGTTSASVSDHTHGLPLAACRVSLSV